MRRHLTSLLASLLVRCGSTAFAGTLGLDIIVPVLLLALIQGRNASASVAIPARTVPFYFAGFRDDSVDVLSPMGTITPLATLPSGVSPNAMTIDPQQNMYVALGSGLIGGDVIEKITPAGATSTYATGLTSISAMTFDKTGNLFVSEEVYDKVIKIATTGTQTQYASLPGEAEALAFDSKGNLFADTLSGYVYKISTSGAVSQFTTTTISGRSGAIDSSDNLYYTVGHSIDKVSPTGAVSLLGSSPSGLDLFAGDAIDSTGDVYVCNYNSENGGSIGVFTSLAPSVYQPVLNLSIGGFGLIAIPTAAVPEPAMMTLILAGMVLTLGRKSAPSRPALGTRSGE